MDGMGKTIRNTVARATALCISLCLGMTCAAAADRAKDLGEMHGWSPSTITSAMDGLTLLRAAAAECVQMRRPGRRARPQLGMPPG